MTKTKEQSFLGRLLVFAVPICLMGLVNTLSTLIAMLFVARLGKTELAASALAYSGFIAVMTISITSLYSVSIIVGRYKGENKAEAIGSVVKNAWWAALLLGIPGTLLLWHMDKILHLVGQQENLVVLTTAYFHYAAYSLIPMLFTMVLSQFYVGIGRPRIPLITVIIRLPFLVLFSYALILGHFGCPRLGLAGVSLAVLIVQIIFCIGLLIYVDCDRSVSVYAIFSGKKWFDWTECRYILSSGIPIGLQFGGELAAMMVGTWFMGWVGVHALAASQIVSQYTMLAVMITLGVAQALSVLVSEAYGAKNFQDVMAYRRAAGIIVAGFTALLILCFGFLNHYLMMPYLNIHDPLHQDVVHLTKDLFIVAIFAMPIDAIRNFLSGCLRGLQDSFSPMLIGVLSLWLVSLPISYLAGFNFGYAAIGIRAGFISGFVVAILLLWKKFHNKLNFLEQQSKPVLPMAERR